MKTTDGEVVDGIFRITKPFFKKGASGVIHLAENLKGEPVALKFLAQAGSPENVENFKREYATLLKFSHPNVARVFGFGMHAGHFYIAYEYVNGSEFRLAVSGLTPEAMTPVFLQGLQGLEAIHVAGFLHLDIKSSNILVTKKGLVKIIDFGLAQAKEKFNASRICGSIPYMAPEMVLGGDVDHTSDLFSFGVLMHSSLCAGFYPFPKRLNAGPEMDKLKNIVAVETSPDKPSRHNIYCPEYLDAVILKMLARKQEDRFGSARAVIDALKTHHSEDYVETAHAKGSYLLPIGNEHIGRKEFQERVDQEVLRILEGETPQESVFWILGESGLGKTHFLRKIKERAETEPEKISLHHLELPQEWPSAEAGGQPWLTAWLTFLEERLAENLKPILILVDNAHTLPPESPLGNFLQSLLEDLENRSRAEATVDGAMPVLICLAGEPFLPFGAKLKLAPFTREEIRSYLSKTLAFQDKEIPELWVERLYKKTGGNPGELAEFLQREDSQGLLFDLDGKILIAHAEDISIETDRNSETLPSSTKKRLEDLLKNRSLPELEILKWISVWQRGGLLEGVRQEELETLTNRNDLTPSLESLVAGGLLERDAKKKPLPSSHFFLLGRFYLSESSRGRKRKKA